MPSRAHHVSSCRLVPAVWPPIGRPMRANVPSGIVPHCHVRRWCGPAAICFGWKHAKSVCGCRKQQPKYRKHACANEPCHSGGRIFGVIVSLDLLHRVLRLNALRNRKRGHGDEKPDARTQRHSKQKSPWRQSRENARWPNWHRGSICI